MDKIKRREVIISIMQTLSTVIVLLFFILLILFAIISKGQPPQDKGSQGESRVADDLERILNGNSEYCVLNDIMFRTDMGTVQIDHIVILPQGFLVIETKNYAGWIFGDENSKYWMQIIYKQKSRFYNPIKQNNGHISALKRMLGNYNRKYWNVRYQSIIVFNDSCTFKKMDTKTPVIHENNLKYFILKYKNSHQPILSNVNIKNVYNFIKEKNITDMEERDQHVRNIKRKM